MSWFIHRCGEHSNRCYAEIVETDRYSAPWDPNVIGPFATKEEAIKKAELRGLTPSKLSEPERQW